MNMRKTTMAAGAALAVGLVLAATGCDAVSEAIGPTCGEFLAASDKEQQDMVLAWMKNQGLAEEDATMTGQSSGGGLMGFQVMANVQSMVNTCKQADSGDRLNEFVGY